MSAVRSAVRAAATSRAEWIKRSERTGLETGMTGRSYQGPMVHCAFGNSFCVAMAQMCAVVWRIFSSSSDSSLVSSLMGSGAASAAEASGSATALEKMLAWRRPATRFQAEAAPGVTTDATGTAAGRDPASAAAALTPRDIGANPTRRAAAAIMLVLPTRAALALTTAGARAPMGQ